VPLGKTLEGNNDFQVTRMGAKPDVALLLPSADAGGKRAAQAGGELIDCGSRKPNVTKDSPGQVSNHGIEPSLVGQLQRKEEVMNRHGARSYSERRLNSKRARVTSAAICAFSASSESNARSSRSRWTSPTRIDDP
jgi:hypothetical protein